MTKNNLSIYILAFNKKRQEYEILSTSEHTFLPPSQEIILNKDIQKNLYSLISKYIDIENDIFGYTFLDINILEHIDIIYYITIPYEYPKKNCYFVPITNTNNEFHIKNIQKILNRI
jgi:hypothetical protein